MWGLPARGWIAPGALSCACGEQEPFRAGTNQGVCHLPDNQTPFSAPLDRWRAEIQLAFRADVRFDAFDQPEGSSAGLVDGVDRQVLARCFFHRHAARDLESVRMIGDRGKRPAAFRIRQ